MDGVSAAASVIAIIQLTQDVYKLCQDYVFAVKDARRDIELLTGEVMALHDILETLDEWMQGTDSAKFGILSKIQRPSGGPLEVCQRELQSIKDTLERFQSTGGSGGQTTMRRVGMRALKWPFSSRELKTKVDALSKGKDTLNLALTAESTVATSGIQEKLASLTISVDSAIKEVSREKVLGWLENTSPVPNHQAAVSKHEESTGEWLLQDERFGEWRSTTGKLLWLHGIPGSGKTILISTMIESLKAAITSTNASETHGSAVVYYYFDFTDPSKQSSSNFLRSILAQIALEEPRAYDIVSQLYLRCKTGQEQPNTQDLLTSLLKGVDLFKDVYLVIDAVDESPRDQQREGLLAVINKLCKCMNLHVAAASREEIDIATNFGKSDTIEIEVAGSGIDSDIKGYISGQLMNDMKLKKFPTQLKNEAQQVLSDKANGMFRWVFCQLDELKKCRTRQKFIEALYSLPENLAGTYERIIDGVDASFREHTLRSLAWIAFAQRPLTVREVAESAVLNLEEDEVFNPDDRFLDPLNDVLELLGSLVILQRSDTADQKSPEPELPGSGHETGPSEYAVVKLAHFTVKEYLTTRWKSVNGQDIGATPEDANFLLSKGCLRYAIFALHRLDDGLELDGKEFPLFYYASNFWPKHIRGLPTLLNRQLEGLKLEILKEPTPLDQWRHTYRDVLAIDSTQLHYAAHHDCLKLVQELVDQGVDATVRNSQGITPAHLAANEGYEEVIQVLMESIGPQLERRAVIPSPLYYACREGHVSTCEAILKYLNPMVSWEQKPYSPLHIAAKRHHLPIVRMLIKYGVPATTRDFYGQTALHSLLESACVNASCDHMAFAEFLISNGIDVNTPNDSGAIPLHLVASGSDIAMAKYLISQGSLIHAQTIPAEGNRTPLHFACSGDVNVDMLKLLLDNGATVNFPALSLACKKGSGHLDAVKLLIDRGASVGIQRPQLEVDNYIPIIDASTATEDNHEIIETLIANGADINSRSEYRWSVLHVCNMGEAGAKNAETLLRHGADISARADNGDTPLLYKLKQEYGGFEIAEVLLKNGADANARDDTGMSALHCMPIWREYSTKKVALLLHYGADINARDKHGTTPLLSVLQNKDFQDLVQSLGDDPQESDSQDGNLDSGNDKIEAVRLLLGSGPDASIGNNVGITPFEVFNETKYSKSSAGRAIQKALKELVAKE